MTIKAEFNEIETKKIQRINEFKSCFFDKIYKMDRQLAQINQEKERDIPN